MKYARLVTLQFQRHYSEDATMNALITYSDLYITSSRSYVIIVTLFLNQYKAFSLVWEKTRYILVYRSKITHHWGTKWRYSNWKDFARIPKLKRSIYLTNHTTPQCNFTRARKLPPTMWDIPNNGCCVTCQMLPALSDPRLHGEEARFCCPTLAS